MSTIQSLNNPTLKRIVELHDNAGQKKYQQFIVEGQRAIVPFYQHDFALEQLYATSETLQLAYDIVRTPTDAQEHLITVVTDAVMKKMSTAISPSGLLAVFNMPKEQKEPDLRNSVALVNLQDPGNMGTLIRTAAALNIKTIIKIDGVNCWSPKVIQATAGTIALVNIVSLPWDNFVALARAQKLDLGGMVVQNGKTPQAIDFSRTILVIGNEAHGLSEKQQQACTALITLPMPGGTESLNAAIAGSIGMYLAYLERQ